MNRFFLRNPWLLFVAAFVVILNIIFEFAPGQVPQGPAVYWVPGVMIFFGIMGYILRKFMPGSF